MGDNVYLRKLLQVNNFTFCKVELAIGKLPTALELKGSFPGIKGALNKTHRKILKKFCNIFWNGDPGKTNFFPSLKKKTPPKNPKKPR